MPNTIEDVVSECIGRYGLEVTDENNELYHDFLKRQLEAHEDYNLNFDVSQINIPNYPFVNLLSDKLYLFSVLIRQSRVRVDEFAEDTETELIDTDEKLNGLKLGGSVSDSWIDSNLHRLYIRRRRKAKKYGTMTYTEIIDELGKDPKVVEIWGRELSYNADVGGKTKRVTPQIS